MTGSADCRGIRHSLGVYVLGAIDPAERSLVDAHLGTCPECREELAGLASLPALLHRIPVAEAQELAGAGEDIPPGPEPSELMLRSLLKRSTGIRRARRWRAVAVAAAAVLVAGLGGAAGWGALHGGAPAAGSASVAAGHLESVTATDAATHVTATIRYGARSWGTVLDTQVRGVPQGAQCELVVTDSAGHATVVGSWTTAYDEGSAWYPGATSVALDSVRSFAITSGGNVLVEVPVR